MRRNCPLSTKRIEERQERQRAISPEDKGGKIGPDEPDDSYTMQKSFFGGGLTGRVWLFPWILLSSDTGTVQVKQTSDGRERTALPIYCTQ